MKILKRIFIIFLTFLIIFGVALYFVLKTIFLPPEPLSEKKVIFEIKRGQREKEIANNLKREGLITSEILFRIYIFGKGFHKKLQAGSYLLSPSMSIPEIARKFVVGDVIRVKITIPEGFNLRQIEEKLKENNLKVNNLFLLKAKDFKEEFEFLKEVPDDATLEGFLFPDTYFFFLDQSEREIVKKMLENFDKKFNSQIKEEAKRQGKSVFEILILASLIEKEVRNFEEKKLVSGILWKRLQHGMPLQVDATITYITGKRTTKISIEETKIDNPYNTYRYVGLPPGPICNPGLESILAALYPKESEYWYYLSTPEGETIFSKTLLEHNIAKAKYLK